MPFRWSSERASGCQAFGLKHVMLIDITVEVYNNVFIIFSFL